MVISSPSREPPENRDTGSNIGDFRPETSIPLLGASISPRLRVIGAIQEKVEKQSLIIIVAPEKSGKTTAISSWVASHHAPSNVVWIDAIGISTPSDLWISVLENWVRQNTAAAALVEKVRTAILAGAPFRSAIAPLIEHGIRGTVIVDGLGIEDPESFLEDLQWLLGGCRFLRAIVSTRSHLAVKNVRAPTGPLLEKDLAMTRSEVVEAAASTTKSLDIKDLWNLTKGNPFVVESVLQSLRLQPELVSRGALRTMVYGAVQSLINSSKVLSAHHDFLLKTSVAPSFSEALAADIVGKKPAETAFKELGEAGFLRSKGGRGAYVTVSRALRNVLRTELCHYHPGLLPEITEAVVGDLLARNRPWPALKAASKLEDLRLMESIMIPWFPRILGTHEGDVLRLLESFPLSKAAQFPALILCQALASTRSPISRGRSKVLASIALAGLNAGYRPPHDNSEAVVYLLLSIAYRISGKWKQAAENARASTCAFDSSPLSVQGANPRLSYAIHLHAGLGLLLGPDPQESLDVFRHALSVSASSGSKGETLLAAGLAAFVLANQGEMHEAKRQLVVAGGDDLLEGRHSLFQQTPYRLSSALISLEDDDLAGAQRHIDHLHNAIPISEFWPSIACIETVIGLRRSQKSVEADVLERLLVRKDLFPLSGCGRIMVVSALVMVYLAHGNSSRPLSILKKEGSSRPAASLCLSSIAVATGSWKAAERRLAAVPAVARGVSLRYQLHMCALQAATHQAHGRFSEASELVDEASRLFRHSGMGSEMMLLPAVAIDYLEAAGLWRDIPRPRAIIPFLETPIRISKREQIVLETLAVSTSATVAAATLGVSLNTVKSQSRTAYRKLGVTSLAQALEAARKDGLFEVD